ncbi:Oxidoreductase [Streptomyces murinus]|uniref:Gfo/Idh/MocA family protein n=1 Tax=Streptomyces murinus TaxID=33900 RepID=UPI003D67402B
MSTDKIRVGVVGANPERSWAARAHLPGLSTLPDYEVTAVATSREESARAAAERFGARHAFTDGRELATSPDVDLVVVAVRVPAHFPLVEAAVAAGKHVYCEWPLGRTTKEAEVLAQAAAASSGHHAVGLQARLAPTVRYARQLIADGYVGQVTSASVRGARDRGTTNQIPGWAAYVLDRFSGAGTLEVAGGHTLDVLEQLLGPVVQLSGALATRRSDFVLAETGAPFQATAADNVLVQGRLADDTPVSVHLHDGRVTEARTTIEIAGTEGTLTLETTGAGAGAGIQISELRLTGSTLAEDGTPRVLTVPAGHRQVPDTLPELGVLNVAQTYARLAEDIRQGTHTVADFDAALRLHRLLDGVRASDESGTRWTA